MLKKIILNVHIYGGLLCFSYLLLLGLSVLNFNHPFGFTKRPASITTWNQPLSVPSLVRFDGRSSGAAMPQRQQNNAAIVHALGSFATPPTFTDGDWTDADTYHAHLARPGKEYEIDVHPQQGTATIKQTRTGFWTLVRDLHGAYATYPGSIIAGTWKGYTELSVYVVIMAGITGVYLWTVSRRERRLGLLLLGAAGVLSVGLMLLVTFHG